MNFTLRQQLGLRTANAAVRVCGRSFCARAGRLLLNAARFDCPNDITSNGEPIVQEIIATRAGDRAIVFDIGANVGAWTIGFLEARKRKTTGQTKIFAFEPCAATRRTLKESVDRAGFGDQVTIVSSAASNECGRAVLNVLAANEGRNSLYERPLGGSVPEEIGVTTVDAFARSAAIEHVSFIKVDAEGHDMMVMEGARELLAAGRVDAVQFEYSWMWVLARRYLRDAFELMGPLGYSIGKVTPSGIEFYRAWDPDLETLTEANFVACLESVKSDFPLVPWWKA